ncbi:MAG: putative 8-oxo-dGTP diphosphatase 1 [Acidimicrobiales bacterium AG-410-I20]|nr:MAG: putative 8-oxo-dGTP diphosphatase 1 [Acidimicrobiales bacterium AG-410-I20]
MIFLIRHASAGSRYDFDGDDADRPLDEGGSQEAQQISEALRTRPIKKIMSSRAVRCQQSIAPLARQLNLEIEIEPNLFEGSHDFATTLIKSFFSYPYDVVACSHGDVIPEILGDLIEEGLQIRGGRSCAESSIWVLSTSNEGQMSGSYFSSPLEFGRSVE